MASPKVERANNEVEEEVEDLNDVEVNSNLEYPRPAPPGRE